MMVNQNFQTHETKTFQSLEWLQTPQLYKFCLQNWDDMPILQIHSCEIL